MSDRPGFDFRGRQISPATRADWRHDARPTNYDGGRTAILARRIIELLDALDAAEERVARLLCERHQAASPTRQPCAACVQAATADRRAHLHAWSGDWPADPNEPLSALVRKWEREGADPEGHSLLTQAYRNHARDLREALAATACAAATAVWTCPDCEGEFPASQVAVRDV